MTDDDKEFIVMLALCGLLMALTVITAGIYGVVDYLWRYGVAR